MKTPSKLVLAAAGIALVCAVFVASHSTAPTQPSPATTRVAEKHKDARKPVSSAMAEAPDPAPAVAVAAPDEDAANLTRWHEHFEQLLQASQNREDAVRELMTQMDAEYSAWVGGEITTLATLPPAERYDRLGDIEDSVREGAAAILDLLGVEGSRHFSVLPGALDAVAAEMEYAEAANEPAQRLALLRLDRERGTRLGEVMMLADASAKTSATHELDTWYDGELGKVFPANETE